MHGSDPLVTARQAVGTDLAVRARQLAAIGELPGAERLARAIALSSLVCDLAWAGARLHVKETGSGDVVSRFLAQLYGREAAARLDALRAAG